MSRDYNNVAVFAGLHDAAPIAQDAANKLGALNVPILRVQLAGVRIVLLELFTHLATIAPDSVPNRVMREELVLATRTHLADLGDYSDIFYDYGRDDIADDITDVIATVESYLHDIDY